MQGHWFVARGKQKEGPFAFAQLVEMARTGGLVPADMVLESGAPRWRAAGEVQGLFWVEESVTGPPPPTPRLGAPALPAEEPRPLVMEPAHQANGIAEQKPPEPTPPVPAPAPAEAIAAPAPVETIAAPAVAVAVPAETAPMPAPATPPERQPDRRRSLARWCAIAAVLSVAFGVAGDFFMPVAPFDLFASVAGAATAVTLLVFWRKRGRGASPALRAGCAVSACVAFGFGAWWCMAWFGGEDGKGFIASRSRFAARLQAAFVGPAHSERLLGKWVRGTEASPEARLDFDDGKFTWRLGSETRLDGEYGATSDGIVYGIFTRVETDAKADAGSPQEEDVFSFRFRVDGDTLTIRDVKGNGCEEVKKAVQGRYHRRR
jgi:hypothetical protein